jgi:ketosteroid isomerase-like protein
MAESNIFIVRKYFQAYADRDRAAIEGLVDEALRFTSPRDNRIDRATYFRRCWKNSEAIVGRKMIQILADGERVFVIYELAWTTGRASRNTELFTLRNGKIVEVEVYFGWSIPHEAARGRLCQNR